MFYLFCKWTERCSRNWDISKLLWKFENRPRRSNWISHLRKHFFSIKFNVFISNYYNVFVFNIITFNVALVYGVFRNGFEKLKPPQDEEDPLLEDFVLEFTKWIKKYEMMSFFYILQIHKSVDNFELKINIFSPTFE